MNGDGPTSGVPEVDPAILVDRLADALVVAAPSGAILMVNASAERLLAAPAGQLVGRQLVSIVPPRLRPAHEAGFARYVSTGQGRMTGHGPIRVAALRADGTEVPVELTLTAVGGPGDSGFAVVASLRDVSLRLELERRAAFSRYLQASVDAARDGVLAVSIEGRVLAVNRRFCEMWNLDPRILEAELPAEVLMKQCVLLAADAASFLREFDWSADPVRETRTLTIPMNDGRTLEGYAAPVVDGFGESLGRVWYLHDDTARREAEAQRNALVEELATVQRSQRFLLDASYVLAQASGFAETLESLAAVAVPTLGDLCLIDVVDERGRMARMAAVHADPSRRELVQELKRLGPDPAGAHPSVDAMRHGRSRWSADMPDEFLRSTTHDERHYRIVKALEFTSYMTVPLVAEGQTLGTVTVVSAGSGRRFDERDVALAEELASRVALVIAKERRYDAERRISHTLQANLLPAQVPPTPGLSLAVRYLPGTRDAEVGGDFWDVVKLPAGEVALTVGDVAGHDITAAATMAQLRSACRALGVHASGPAELVDALHATWDQLGLDRMATAVFAAVHPATGRLRIASAGHLPPVIVEPDRAWVPALDVAAPFGAPSAAALEWRGRIPPGTTLIFYTDGLVEDRSRDIDEGTGRLLRAASAAGASGVEEIADRILAVMPGDERGDDVALLVARLL